MISARMSSCRVWKSCISAISTLIAEAAFRFTPEGVRLRAMDPTHISLVQLEFPAKMFEEYRVKEERIVGLSVSRLDEFLSRARGDEEIRFELDEEQNRLILTLKGVSTRKFGIPLIDVSEPEVPEPGKLELPAAFDVLAGALAEGLKDAQLVGDSVKFQLEPNGLTLSAKGEKGSSEVLIKEEKGEKKAIELKESPPAVKGTFAIEYLSNILKAADPEDWVRVRMGQDMPIRLELAVGEGKEKGSLVFVLAPRLETE
jgi:proliferating cell nuclear antigen